MHNNKSEQHKILKRLAKILSLVIVLAVIAGLMQEFIMARMDAHSRRMQGFYMEEKDSLDMVIIGSSEIYNGFMPDVAYENYGISTYLYGFQANPACLWEYQLKEIERTQSPDILVVECNGAGYDNEELNDPAEVRFMTDDMPLSLNKIQLIHDRATEGKPSYYFPMIKYHQKLIPGGDTLNVLLLKKRGFHILRGAQARVTGEDFSNNIIDVTGDDSVADLDTDGEASLRAFLEQCKESEIEHIVFVRFPHVVTDFNYLRFQRYHRMEQIIEEAGFDYIDFDDYKDDMGVKDTEDFLDCEHMNLIGAEKLTNFMTPYLMERYQIEPREQSEKALRQWDESVDYYHHLREYWIHVMSLPPEEKANEDDLNDNYNSKKRIEAYFEDF